MRVVRGWAGRTVGGLPATFWYLWAGTLVNRLGAFVLPFLAIYLTAQRGFSASFAGLAVGLYGAGAAAGTVLGGVLADRWGRRPTLLTAHLGAATTMVVLGLAERPGAIVGGAVLLGAFAEGSRPAFQAMIVDVVPAKDRLRAFTLNYWAVNLGFACAAVLAGLIAEAGYLLLFLADAATTLVTAGLVFWKVGESRARSAQPAPPAVPGSPATRARGLHTALGDRVFIGYLALNLLIALVFMQHLTTLPIAMGADGISPARYGSVIALNGLLIVAGQLFVPRLIGSADGSRVLAAAAVLVGIGFGLVAVADTVPMYALAVVIWTAGEMLSSPSNATMIAELSPADLRGRYQGLFSLSWSVAGFLAPVIGGFVQQHLGGTALWLACAAVSLLTAAGQLAAGPARRRRIAKLRAAPRPAAVPAASAPTAQQPTSAPTAG